MGERIRALDWAATPLGPLGSWPQSLRTTVELMLGSPQMACTAWGPGLTLLYNDAYAGLLGAKHPAALGKPFAEVWPGPEVQQMVEATFQGQAHRFVDQRYDFPARTEQPIGWFTGSWTPLTDEAGRVAGVYAAGVETTDKVLAEQALRDAQGRQSFLLGLSDALRPLADPNAIQAEACRLLGERLGTGHAYYLEVQEAKELLLIERDFVRGGLAPLVREYPLSAFRWALPLYKRGRPIVVSDLWTTPLVPAPDRQAMAEARVIAWIAVPLVKRGELVGALCVAEGGPREWSAAEVRLAEETAERIWAAIERARAEKGQRESEARLARVFEMLPVGVAVIDSGGALLLSNDEMRRFIPTGKVPSMDPERWDRWRGFRPDGSLIPPKDFPSALALRGESTLPGIEMTYRDDDGRDVWTRVASTPLLDEQNRVLGAVTVVVDIDKIKRGEARQATLLGELQHRVRNILAMVRSLARRTTEAGESVAEVAELLDGRISALARTQALLTRAAGAGADLEMLVREELLAQAAEHDRISVEGPPVLLSPEAAEVLALAVHELATNAAKYGAISQGGSLKVSWRIEGGANGPDWLRLTWSEAGVKVVAAHPRRVGFGTELIERRVPYDLNGRGRIELRPGGLHAEIAFPLVAGESTLATEPSAVGA